MEDGRYKIVRTIQTNEGFIQSGTDLYLVHGVFYMDGGMLDRSYQEDFMRLLKTELNNGWNYLRPIDYV